MTPYPILNFFLWAVACLVLLVVLLAVLNRYNLI